MNIENVEKQKRGRKLEANPKKNRLWIRLNNAEQKQLLQLFEKSGKRSMSAFIADCVLNRPMKIVEVNKSVIDFIMLLSSFFAQFRAVKNNFNQMYSALVRNFGEEKAMQMIQIVAASTRKFGLLKRQIEETAVKLREQCLPK
jgi:hypothetical protein